MSGIDLRAATSQDIPALNELVQNAYRGDSARAGWTHESDLLDGQRTDAASLGAILSDDRNVVLLALRADALVGCVQVTAAGGGASLGMLAVDPRCQADGIGRTLIGAAEEVAVERFGASVMEMTVIRQRPELIAYYQRRGYAPTGEVRDFPYGDPRFGLPRTGDLVFVVLAKDLVRLA